MTSQPDENLYYIVYVSTATRLLGEAELRELLRKAQVANAERDITGLLLYHDGDFIQTLEGPRDAVETLFAKIAGDPRHRRVIRLMHGPLAKRQFPNWSMGLRRISDLSAEDARHFSDFLTADRTSLGREDANAAYRLLLSFRDTIRG
ncbi:MAG: BLUF domain-containing protein [Candidatus Eisenbacteria bacterium]|nr:BLUF domain-containing protein [Candidatus Eisenbacteria bacterium]